MMNAGPFILIDFFHPKPNFAVTKFASYTFYRTLRYIFIHILNHSLKNSHNSVSKVLLNS